MCRIIEDSHFDAPKSLESIFKDDIAQVVCQVPSSSSDTQKQKVNTDNRDTSSTDQDRQLNDKIHEKLSGGWFSKAYDKTVTTSTNDGIVTVSGTVDTSEDVQKVIDKIKSIDGVKSINNRLTVQK